MADNRRPTGRKTRTTGNSSGVHLHGEGLGTGPVGSQNGYQGRKGGSSGTQRAAIGGGGLTVIVIILMIIFGKGGGMGTDSSSNYDQGGNVFQQPAYTETIADIPSQTVDTSVASGSRAKRTKILGNGEDKITMMVYMCGTDLESKYGMGTNDLREMASADIGSNIDIIVYTGGCNGWKTNGISTTVNQIYRITKGGIENLVKDDGAKPMTDPDTLTGFIKYCAQNFPANRYELIMWDHGGGSVSGYGYDEKYKSSGSMRLGEIDKALKNSGVTFDFIGFDACLMATAETALMLDNYADYMIASEETEPGIGWYYTNWLTKLGADTSMSTIKIGKNIIDDFTAACSQQCRGQKTTLSITDLAEFKNTVPDKLASFSNSISEMISDQNYKQVSDARYVTREFAQSSRIDQVDLADLALKLGNSEGRELADAIRDAVKYNRTSGIADAYGISVYFPLRQKSYVDTACQEYNEIGMDSSYAKAIRQFASLQVSGQAVSGGSSAASPIGSLFGGGSSSTGADMVGSLLGAFLGGDYSSISGLDAAGFLSDRAMSDEQMQQYLEMNHFDASSLFWSEQDGKHRLTLSDSQWDMVHEIDMNMFFDTGTGYADLGLDNLFDTEGNDIIADERGLWMAIDGHICAYYHTDTSDVDGEQIISGYIPAYVNGERVKMLVTFDDADPYGRITGAVTDYHDGETETVAKTAVELRQGDKIELICDFYDYNGEYYDTYYLGEAFTLSGDPYLSNEDVGGKFVITYRLTDIYEQEYWTPQIK